MKEGRNSEQELKQRHGEVLLTGLFFLTSQFVFLYTQDSLPEGSTTYNELNQPTSVTNQEKPVALSDQGIFFQWRFLPLKWRYLTSNYKN